MSLIRFYLVLVIVSLSFGMCAQISTNALHFDGTNMVVVGEHSNFDLQPTSSTTFEGWFRFCGDGMVYSKNWCEHQAGYYFNVVNSGQMRLSGVSYTTCNSGSLFLLTTTQTYAPNTWHHFAVIVQVSNSNTDVKLYMNGVLALSQIVSGALNNSNQPLILGAYRNLSGAYGLGFNGDIDEFRVYNTVVPQNQLGLATPTNPSLILRYEMEPQSNPTATSEPNVGSMGTGFNGSSVLLSSSVTTTPLVYTPTNVYNPTVDLGPDIALNCSANTVTLNANSSANSFSWYESAPFGNSWQQLSGANSSTLNYSMGSNAAASVVVSATNGLCVATDTINITTANSAVQIFGNDTTICFGSSLVLDASAVGGTYEWQDGSANSTFTVTNSGTYFVDILSNGCTYSDTISVTVLQPSNIDLGNDTTLCPGASLLLDASAFQGSYTWQDGSTGATFNANQAGIYWVAAANVCGMALDSIVVDYTPLISIDLGNDTTICDGDQVLLNSGLSSGTVTWQDGSVGYTYLATDQGLYTAEYNANGCIFSDQIFITLDQSGVVDLGEDLLVCNGEQALISVSDDHDSYAWSTGSSEHSIVVNSPGVYSVIATNSCGSTTDSILVTYEECFCILFVPNSFTPDNDNLNETFGAVADCPLSKYQLQIFDRWGEVIFESNDINTQWDATYRGRPVQDGIYTYKIWYSSEFVVDDLIHGHVVVIR